MVTLGTNYNGKTEQNGENVLRHLNFVNCLKAAASDEVLTLFT